MQLQKITALQNSVQLLVCTMQILSDAALLLLKSLNNQLISLYEDL